MERIKKHYDRVLVLVLGALALLGSLFLIAKALGFSAQFTQASVIQGTRLEPLPEDRVVADSKRLESFTPWARPKVGQHKTTPLFASTPFVVMNDKPLELIDMTADNAPQMRPPIENWWLVENDLDYTSIDVSLGDPDRDSYANLDEWEGKTDPNSSLSKPPFYTKLYFAELIKEPLTLRLSSFDSGTAAIRFTTKDASGNEQSRNEYIKVGTASRDGRFRVNNVNNETVTKFGSPTVVPVATVIDTKARTPAPIRLPQGENVEHPTNIAKVIYTLTNETFEVKEGLDFEVKRPVGMTITVEEIHADHAIFSFVPEGKAEEMRLKKELRPPPK